MANLWNSHALISYLHDAAEGDELLATHLETALLKALKKPDATLRHIEPVTFTTLPEDAPEWMREKYPHGGQFEAFTPTPPLNEKVRHVADWIKAALVNEEAWLEETDEKGRPRRLREIGELDRAVHYADEAMISLRQGPVIEEGTTWTWTHKQFDHGYRIVELLTPEALDRESQQMGHCIGNGSYDDELLKGNCRYYSLRDAKNQAHVTFEVRDNVLIQCQGKENNPPVSKYLPMIQEFIREEGMQLDCPCTHTGLLEQNGQYYDIQHLPGNFVVNGDLDLAYHIIPLVLPENLEIKGNLTLYRSSIAELPKGLKVQEMLNIENTAISVLPVDLEVGSFIYVSNTPISVLPAGYKTSNLELSSTNIVSLPENLEAHGFLKMSGTAITSLPTGLIMEGDLDLSHSAVMSLPENLEIKGDLDIRDSCIKALPKCLKIRGGLEADGTEITSLPEDLEVQMHLNISNTSISSLPLFQKLEGGLILNDSAIAWLPENLEVEGHVYLRNTPIAALPIGLKVMYDLDLTGTAIITLPKDLEVRGEIIGIERSMTKHLWERQRDVKNTLCPEKE